MDWKRTGKKLLHVLGMVLLALVIIIALLAMLGTVAHEMCIRDRYRAVLGETECRKCKVAESFLQYQRYE